MPMGAQDQARQAREGFLSRVMRRVFKARRTVVAWFATVIGAFTAGGLVTAYVDKLNLFSGLPAFYRECENGLSIEGAAVLRDARRADVASIRLKVRSALPYAVDVVWIGATAVLATGEEFYAKKDDVRVRIPGRGVSEVGRAFTFPDDAPPGRYTFIVRLLHGNTGDTDHSVVVSTVVSEDAFLYVK